MNALVKNYPFYNCTNKTGRCEGYKSRCERYVTYQIFYGKLISKQKENLMDRCGNFRGYTFLPSGRIRGKYKEWLHIKYIRGKPYVYLSENGINGLYQLDKVMWKAYHVDFNIESDVNIVHKDGNFKNCSIKNLICNEYIKL